MGAEKSRHTRAPTDPEPDQTLLDRTLIEAVINNRDDDTIEALLEAGANARGAIHLAAISGKYQIFELLFGHTRNLERNGLLRFIIDSIDYESNMDTIQQIFQICIYLRRRGPFVMPDIDQRLMKKACQYNNLEVIKLCGKEYKRGFDFDKGILMRIAVENAHDNIIIYLRYHTNVLDTPNFSFGELLKSAVKSGNQEIIDLCLRKLDLM